MHRVVALAIESVVAFDLSAVAQIFGHPTERDRYSFAVCTASPGVVATSSGFQVMVPDGLELLDTADTVIVAGFHPKESPGQINIDALRRVHDRGARVASVSLGAFALAGAGLLDGRTATTHWHATSLLATMFPRVRVQHDVLYVDEGDVLTSAGLSAAIDLCLHMIRHDHGAHVASEIAGRLIVGEQRSGHQTQHAHRSLPADGGLSSTREWAIVHMEQPLTLTRLARHAGLPVRTFARQFRDETGMSPIRWLTAQRVREAQRLLETTDLSVDEVAEHSGFGTATTLRLHLGRELGTTPLAYRRSRRKT